MRCSGRMQYKRRFFGAVIIGFFRQDNLRLYFGKQYGDGYTARYYGSYYSFANYTGEHAFCFFDRSSANNNCQYPSARHNTGTDRSARYNALANRASRHHTPADRSAADNTASDRSSRNTAFRALYNYSDRRRRDGLQQRQGGHRRFKCVARVYNGEAEKRRRRQFQDTCKR